MWRQFDGWAILVSNISSNSLLPLSKIIIIFILSLVSSILSYFAEAITFLPFLMMFSGITSWFSSDK